MPNLLHVPVPTRIPALCWNGRQSAISSLLFINQDLNNTVWLGNDQSIMAGNVNTIPILPNGTFSADPNSPWYVIGNTAGTSPLVVVPNGQGYFLGITAGLGKLVIPSIRSPNYVPSISGWTINKDGSAEFNNLTIRGNFVFSDGFISDGDGTFTSTPGLFFYSGIPSAGNLIYSNTSTAGHDVFNNNYLAGETQYNNSLNQALNLANSPTAAITFYDMSGNPGSTFTAGGIINGLASVAGILMQFGNGGLELQDSSVGGASSIIHIGANGNLQQVPADGEFYIAGHLQQQSANGQLINSTTPALVKTFSFVEGGGGGTPFYRVTGKVQYTGNQSAGTPLFAFGAASDTAVAGHARGWYKYWIQGNPPTGVINEVVDGAASFSVAPVMVNGVKSMLEFDFTLQFSASGTWSLVASTSVAADTFNITFMDMRLEVAANP